MFQYYPAWSTVEVNLQRLRERGHPELAETLVADLERIAGRRLTRKSPQVPVAKVLAHWETFVEDVLPGYVAALHQPGNGTAQPPGNRGIAPEAAAEPGLAEPNEPIGLASG